MIHFCILFSFFLVLLFLKVYVNSFKDHVWQPRRSNPHFLGCGCKSTTSFWNSKAYTLLFLKKVSNRSFSGRKWWAPQRGWWASQNHKALIMYTLTNWTKFLKLLDFFIETFLGKGYYNNRSKLWLPYCVWKYNKDVSSRPYCVSSQAYCSEAIL